MLHPPVRDKPLQPADSNRFTLDPAHTFTLALRLLRADTSTDSRQAVGQRNFTVCAGKIALSHLCNELRDMYVDRTAGHTRLMLAVQASLRFLHRHLSRIAERDLLEIMVAYIRRLFRHRMLLRRHIRHCVFLLSGGRYGPGPRDPRPRALYKSCCGASARRNRPHGRQNPGRRHMQISSGRRP